MKTHLIAASVAIMVVYSCSDSNSRYIDLNSGKSVELKKDDKSGLMVNAETGKPLTLYVDTRTNDTINGKTGKVVNGSIRKADDGRYTYENESAVRKESSGGGDYKIKYDDGEYKIKKGDYKKEVEKDGDITIKDGDTKIKIDGETGERKVKRD
jgi:hypothetical protein